MSEMSPANSGTNTNNGDGLMGWFTRLMSRHIRATRRKLGGHLAMSRPRHHRYRPRSWSANVSSVQTGTSGR